MSVEPTLGRNARLLSAVEPTLAADARAAEKREKDREDLAQELNGTNLKLNRFTRPDETPQARTRRENDRAAEFARAAAGFSREQWDRQTVTIGGVRMTNAQALSAARKIDDNAEEYAQRAIREGKIRTDQMDEYVRISRESREMWERYSRGEISQRQMEEHTQETSRNPVGRVYQKNQAAVSEATGLAIQDAQVIQSHTAVAQTNDGLQRVSIEQIMVGKKDNAPFSERGGVSAARSISKDREFAKAPDIQKAYGQAMAATYPLEKISANSVEKDSPKIQTVANQSLSSMGIG